MSCAHGYPGRRAEGIFLRRRVRPHLRRGALRGGSPAAGLAARVALFTDRTVEHLEPFARARSSLRDAGVDAAIRGGEGRTDRRFVRHGRGSRRAGASTATSRSGRVDHRHLQGRALYATYPADFLTYVNRPVGAGEAVRRDDCRRNTCPTTAGRQGVSHRIAVCDVLRFTPRPASPRAACAPRWRSSIPTRWRRSRRASSPREAFDVLPRHRIATAALHHPPARPRPPHCAR